MVQRKNICFRISAKPFFTKTTGENEHFSSLTHLLNDKPETVKKLQLISYSTEQDFSVEIKIRKILHFPAILHFDNCKPKGSNVL
jgi:hypothetical protein